MYLQSKISSYLPALLSVVVLVTVLISPAICLAQQGALGDMIFDDKIASMKKAGVVPPVFPHTLHEKLDKCATCHESIFKKKRGANDISMRSNMKGQFCGSANCHNTPRAFALYLCNKCHKK